MTPSLDTKSGPVELAEFQSQNDHNKTSGHKILRLTQNHPHRTPESWPPPSRLTNSWKTSRKVARQLYVLLTSKTTIRSQSRLTLIAQKAPYSETKTLKVLAAYEQNFIEGAVLWLTTDRPGDALNYRFYERRPVEVLDIAIKKADLLEPNNSLATLLKSWSKPWGSSLHVVPEQSCDFDAEKGLTKAWAHMGGLRPLDDILSVDGVPALHRPTQRHLSLSQAQLYPPRSRRLALQHRESLLPYQQHSTDEALSESQATDDGFLGWPHFPPPQEVSPHGYAKVSSVPTVSPSQLHVDVGTGDIKRVAFYALGLPPQKISTGIWMGDWSVFLRQSAFEWWLSYLRLSLGLSERVTRATSRRRRAIAVVLCHCWRNGRLLWQKRPSEDLAVGWSTNTTRVIKAG